MTQELPTHYEPTEQPDGTWLVTWHYADGRTKAQGGWPSEVAARSAGYAGMCRPSRFSARQAQYGRYSS